MKDIIAWIVLIFIVVVIGGGNLVLWLFSLARFLGGPGQLLLFLLINLIVLMIATAIFAYCTRPD